VIGLSVFVSVPRSDDPELNITCPVLHAASRRQRAMASEKNLQELFHEMLKDIYFAEKKILSALSEMAEAA
jgi:hypothetical protein